MTVPKLLGPSQSCEVAMYKCDIRGYMLLFFSLCMWRNSCLLCSPCTDGPCSQVRCLACWSLESPTGQGPVDLHALTRCGPVTTINGRI